MSFFQITFAYKFKQNMYKPFELLDFV